MPDLAIADGDRHRKRYIPFELLEILGVIASPGLRPAGRAEAISTCISLLRREITSSPDPAYGGVGLLAIIMSRGAPRAMKVTVIARRPQADEAISSNYNEIASLLGPPPAVRAPRNDSGAERLSGQ